VTAHAVELGGPLVVRTVMVGSAVSATCCSRAAANDHKYRCPLTRGNLLLGLAHAGHAQAQCHVGDAPALHVARVVLADPDHRLDGVGRWQRARQRLVTENDADRQPTSAHSGPWLNPTTARLGFSQLSPSTLSADCQHWGSVLGAMTETSAVWWHREF
jgi:hypothetical protein